MAFDTIWQGLSKMDSGIVAILVVESYAIAISTLRVDIYGGHSWEFITEVFFEFFNVIVFAPCVTMDWSNTICLMNSIVPRSFMPLLSLLLVSFWWRWGWMVHRLMCLAATTCAAHDLYFLFYII